MEPTFAPLERLHGTTKHFAKHALSRHKLGDEPSVMHGAPMPGLPRYRRQQAWRGAELTPQPGRPSYRTRDGPAPIIETEANATRELASDDVEMLA
jgi:hypothetical protein